MLQPAEMPLIVSGMWNDNAMAHYQTNGHITNGKLKTSPPRLPPLDLSLSTLANGGAILPAAFVESLATTQPNDRLRNSSDASSAHPVPTQHALASIDSNLRVYNNPHRRSSPARFPTTPSSSLALSPESSLSRSDAPKLQHRHTLEVPIPIRPAPAAPRTSREQQIPQSAASEDAYFGSARLSSPSTHRGHRSSFSFGRRASRSMGSDLHLEESTHDEESARIVEALRQKRAARRRKKDEEEDDKVLMGTKVDKGHVNYETAYNMLTGIRHTVSRLNAKLDRVLEDEDFDACQTFAFDVTGCELTPSTQYDFKFKDYAPWVFRHLRASFNLDPADYLISLTSRYILSELGSPGKSGSFFYYSRDFKYIIKTIHHAEHKALRKILRDYYDHVRENPDTLLSQFYGLHRVKVKNRLPIHFVVMNNLFPPHRDIHLQFDLKGSTIGRDFKEELLDKTPRATLKDLNWTRRNMHLNLGPQKKKAFVEQMERDVKLLQKLRIMDYSLLVGIHDREKGNEEDLRNKTLQVFQPGGDDDEVDHPQRPHPLVRTPSKLETARMAHELRQTLKSQKPIPMDASANRMPDEMPDALVEERKNFYFYGDEGGFRASHDDDCPGEEVYYLGIIDCLTRYGMKKRGEHFFKALVQPEKEISAIPPVRYGNRFVSFISGIAVPRESAGAEKAEAGVPDRVRTTFESSGGSFADGGLPTTLPIVEEAVEGNSPGREWTGNGHAIVPHAYIHNHHEVHVHVDNRANGEVMREKGSWHDCNGPETELEYA